MDTADVNAHWSKVTSLHPIEGAILVAMIIALLLCKRRFIVWPLIVVACFVVSSQRIVVGTLDFTLMRIIIVVGVMRVLLRGEYHGIAWNKLDLAYTIFILMKPTIALFGDFEPGEFVQRLGFGLDSLGMYFTCRCAIRTKADLLTTIRGFVWIGVPVAACFLNEALTHKNIFSAFGYVSEEGLIRDGRYRAQAAFSHPILAGVYWAVITPWMIALFYRGSRREKFEAVIGLIVSTIIIMACASSTPIMTLMFGLVGAAFFPLRGSMRVIRWSLLVGFIAFQILSVQPAWRLLAYIDLTGGSTGYYRYKLIDQAVKHIGEWGLMGGNIDTTQWSQELNDDTNNFLMIGLQGGLPLLTAFVIVISLAFGSIGRAWRYVGSDRRAVVMAWALGVSLFMHIMSFIGVYYFGQINMLWDLTLAMISSMRPTNEAMKTLSKRSTARQRKLVDPSGEAPVPVSAAFFGK